MSELNDPAQTNLGRIGRCIYCGATEGLSDEHVVPKALGGPAQLYDATCRDCQKITARFERRVLHEQLLPFRTRLGLPTYRPSKRPKDFPARVRHGKEWMDVRLPLDQYTAVAPFLRFPPPGVVEGREVSAAIRLRGVAVTVVPRDGIGNDPPRRAGADAVKQNVPLYPAEFMRMLAKIAWGFSVSLFGLDRIDPAILGVILGTDRDLARWVGCPPPGMAVFDEPTAHLCIRVADVKGFVVAWIRLFGAMGAPEYMVVVGRLRSEAA
jgi:hypothetical protein